MQVAAGWEPGPEIARKIATLRRRCGVGGCCGRRGRRGRILRSRLLPDALLRGQFGGLQSGLFPLSLGALGSLLSGLLCGLLGGLGGLAGGVFGFLPCCVFRGLLCFPLGGLFGGQLRLALSLGGLRLFLRKLHCGCPDGFGLGIRLFALGALLVFQ